MNLMNNLCAVVMCGALASQVAEAQSRQTLKLDVSVSDFDQDDGPDSGRQIFAPFQYTYSAPRFDLGLKAAFLSSERKSTFAGGSGDVSTLTDTALSATYRAYAGAPAWLGRGNYRTTLALNADLNLPTGKSKLKGDERNAVFDGFIVDQNRFGEGFNVGLGFSSTVALAEQILFGFGASYISRGSYEPGGTRELDPGDQWVASLQLLRATNVFQGVLGYRIIREQETDVDGAAVYHRATSHELFLSGGYQMTGWWTLRGSALYARRGVDKLFNSVTGQLQKAAEDNNGDTYYLSVGLDRALSSRDKIGIDLSYLRRAENEFDESNFSFEPSLTRREIEISYARKLQNGPTLTGSIIFFDVEEGKILGFDGPRFEGIKLKLGVTYAF